MKTLTRLYLYYIKKTHTRTYLLICVLCINLFIFVDHITKFMTYLMYTVNTPAKFNKVLNHFIDMSYNLSIYKWYT